MIQLYGELHSIDYEILASHIQVPLEMRKPVPHWLIKLLGKILVSHFSGILRLIIPKKEIQDFFKEYGVSFSKLELKDISLIEETTDFNNMLNITVSIDRVDWDVLSDRLDGIPVSGGSSNLKNGDSQIQQVAEIVKPFINDTVATVPPSAMVELFDLLGKDKVMEWAESYGVTVSAITVKSDVL